MTVHLDDGGIDRCILHVRIIRDRIEDVCENASLDPVAVALEHSVPLAKVLRQIAPRAACARYPQNRLKELAVVIARPTRITGLAQTMRLHLRPLGICQYASVHGKLLSELESRFN